MSSVNYNLIGISQCLIITIKRCKILKTRPISGTPFQFVAIRAK